MELKPCPVCGRAPTVRVLPSVGGSIYIASVRCDYCHIEKKIAYSPGRVNKPKNADVTAKRLASEEWNRRVGEGEKK